MDEINQTETCAHPSCDCTVEMSDEYCSDYCRNSTGAPDAECKCGHPECG